MPETTPPPRAAFAPWDRRQLPGLFDVEESARRVGHYKWIEMRLFEALGGWVATVPELDIKMRLGTHCYHHAWHSELWHKRLPELREMNPDRLCGPPNDAFVTFVDAVTEPEAPELTIEKLVGVYRVLIPHEMRATLETFATLPPGQRKLCIDSFGKLAQMSPVERAQFLKNAERWRHEVDASCVVVNASTRLLRLAIVHTNAPELDDLTHSLRDMLHPDQFFASLACSPVGVYAGPGSIGDSGARRAAGGNGQ